MKKGFFQIGLIVIVASVFVAGLLVNKVKFSLPKADSCSSYTDSTSCSSSCSPVKGTGNQSFKCKWLSASSHCVESNTSCGGDTQTVCPAGTHPSGCLDHIAGQTSICECYKDGYSGCINGYADCSVLGKCMDTYVCSVQPPPTNKPPQSTPTPTPKPTPSKTPTPTPTKSPSPTPTPSKTPSPTPTSSPTPTATPVRSCNSICSNDSQCPSGMGCYKKLWSSTGYCRNMTCSKNENCLCASPTPTASPTLSPTPSATPVAKAYLRICKYKDENGNGYKDSEDGGISWSFKYEYDDAVHGISNDWWRVWDKACAKVEVPVGKSITVSEEGKSGWELTGIYADSSKQTGGNYIYNSEAGKTKEVWFLNKVNVSATPVVGEPNSCNGTCGSNSNCQSGLYCYKGYCRNPQNPESTSCNNPEVLSATAPPVLPKTGSNIYVNLLGMFTLAGTGIYLYKKFKLV